MERVISPLLDSSKLTSSLDDWSYLNVILEAYQKSMIADPLAQGQMSMDQHALMAYAAFHSHVSVGGFIQLIQNGYGAYIFENPFSEIFGSWGAIQSKSIIEEARKIFIMKRTELERETSLEEFTKMYQEIPDFDDLDQSYVKNMENQAAIVRSYVQDHLESFVKIKETYE